MKMSIFIEMCCDFCETRSHRRVDSGTRKKKRKPRQCTSPKGRVLELLRSTESVNKRLGSYKNTRAHETQTTKSMKASSATATTQKMFSVLLSVSPLQEMSNAHEGNGLAMLLLVDCAV